MSSLWIDCLNHLQTKVSATDFNTWLRPLQANFANGELTLYAHNQFVEKWVKDHFWADIVDLARYLGKNEDLKVSILVGSKPAEKEIESQVTKEDSAQAQFRTNLDKRLVFENFVQGQSNQLAKAIAQDVAVNMGAAHCNPYSIYGSTGLGKTHLLHAIGNEILKNNAEARVVYIHSERFFQDMVKALKANTIENFKKFYRSLDVLMIDDIQFLADKPKGQEEFLHLFNSLFERQRQIIFTSNDFPKNIENIEERLKSRLSWGISAAIEPPELETRVAILIKKAEERGITLPDDVAYFLGQKLRTNVRELESAINRVVATQKFTKRQITVDFAREALKDMIASHDYLVTIENIQKTVADYYNIKVEDLKSKSRSRSVARPRQMAMALAKELTSHSLPEIGRGFGGKDHTTVMHACKTINEKRAEDTALQEDYITLTRKLSS